MWVNSIISRKLWNMKVVESISCFLLVGKGCRILDNFVYYLVNSIFIFLLERL